MFTRENIELLMRIIKLINKQNWAKECAKAGNESAKTFIPWSDTEIEHLILALQTDLAETNLPQLSNPHK